jgi:SAM-dependent methyltransferase
MDPKTHWEEVYRTRIPDQVSWYQPRAHRSLALIQRVCPPPGGPIIDVGAGSSTLVDDLLEAGYSDLTALDISATALARVRARLATRGAGIIWIEANVLEAALPPARYLVWHDRAVFHFLTAAADRVRYVDQVRRAVQPGGWVVISTFAEDGPARCSGLDVVRYSAEALHREFGPGFRLVSGEHEEHATPGGARQKFVYCLFEHRGDTAGPRS